MLTRRERRMRQRALEERAAARAAKTVDKEKKAASEIVDRLNQLLDPKGWANKNQPTRLDLLARPHPRRKQFGVYTEGALTKVKRFTRLTNDGTLPREFERPLLGSRYERPGNRRREFAVSTPDRKTPDMKAAAAAASSALGVFAWSECNPSPEQENAHVSPQPKRERFREGCCAGYMVSPLFCTHCPFLGSLTTLCSCRSDPVLRSCRIPSGSWQRGIHWNCRRGCRKGAELGSSACRTYLGCTSDMSRRMSSKFKNDAMLESCSFLRASNPNTQRTQTHYLCRL